MNRLKIHFKNSKSEGPVSDGTPVHHETWLTRKEIEEMVREFDIEGQGRFDTKAFIKAWKDLAASEMHMKPSLV